ncbi:DUF4913 domain-containing protein [Embleya sp. MST-111070]|uniref:DUF4913 domain-containing protein n=1 Tax=Embleya sp. MST-111070 TaxID=3398231 RepID=UPI003F733BBC
MSGELPDDDVWGQGDAPRRLRESVAPADAAARSAPAPGVPRDPTPEPDPDFDEEPEPEFVFESVDAFVVEYLAKVIERRLNRSSLMWCSGWWRHPEAVIRLTAIWRAFEYLRHDAALGMSNWWLQHADPHLRVLMDPEMGPFVACDPREGHTERPLAELPLEPSPPEMWDDPAFRVAPRDPDATWYDEVAPDADEDIEADAETPPEQPKIRKEQYDLQKGKLNRVGGP